MSLCKIIKNIYIFLSIFVLASVCVTTMSLLDVLPALILMWVTYFCFYLGYNRYKQDNNTTVTSTKSYHFLFDKVKFPTSVIAIIFSLLITRFYTGQTPRTIVSDLISGNSLYFLYQKHQEINNIGVFSISKLPYIFMNFGLNLILIYSFITLLIIKKEVTFQEKLFLFTIAGAFIFFGIARGTNFEIFELCVLIMYIVFVRNNKKILKHKITLKSKVLIAIIVSISIYIFSLVISGRGTVGYYITSEIGYDSTKTFSKILPGVSILISKLTAYFGFGFYYLSAFFYRLWITNMSNFIAGFIPVGFKFVGINNLKNKMETLIDAGANWRPDVIDAINYFGLIGLFILVYLLGKYLSYLNSKDSKDIVFLMLSYLTILQMFSLPIGNFIIISSANKLVTLFVILWGLKRKVFKQKKNLA